MFALAADLLEHRGLLKTRAGEVGIWYRHQLPQTDPRKGRTTTVGAIASACVHRGCIRAEAAHLAHLRGFAGVKLVPQVEEGRNRDQVVELLRSCARTLIT